MLLTKEFRFEASHQLQHDKGKCSRLHGHSWKLTVCVGGQCDEHGIVVNYRDIKAALEPLIEGLDHWHLGYENFAGAGCHITSPVVQQYLSASSDNFEMWEPTSENLLYVIADWITLHAPSLNWLTLKLEETCTASAILTREEYDLERKEENNARQTIQQEGKGNEEGKEV